MAALRAGSGVGETADRVDESQLMRLETSLADKRVWADVAELYSILQATEHLETAFISDAITVEQYNAQCNKWVPRRSRLSRFFVAPHEFEILLIGELGCRLLGQFKLLEESLRSSIDSVESFMTRFNIRLPQAHKRLVVDRVPATAMNKTAHSGNEGALIFETVRRRPVCSLSSICLAAVNVSYSFRSDRVPEVLIRMVWR